MRVDGISAARMYLEVGVGDAARSVSRVPGESDDFASVYTTRDTGKRREMCVVVHGAVVAIELHRKTAEASDFGREASGDDRNVRCAERREHVIPLVLAAT